MTPEAFRSLIPEYLSEQLTPDEKHSFEQQLLHDAALRVEVEELRDVWKGLAPLLADVPSAVLRARFYQKLNALNRDRSVPAGKRFLLRLAPLKQIAIGLFIFVLGLYVGQVHRTEQGHADELAQLRAQVQGLRETVALSLMERQSATSRLEGVAWTNRLDQPKDQILSALISALNHDSNVNVRLASLNALERFAANSQVERALVESLPRQDSPLVQISLIDLLVQSRNRAAGQELNQLTRNAEVNAAVRQRAHWGLQQLKLE
jgi:hypothetical protein